MIVNTIDQCLFRQTFHNYGRGDQFSYEGLNALFDYLEELSEDTGINIELDVIALCCEFTEYADLEEIKSHYSNTTLESVDDLHEHTQAIQFETGIIIQDF
jgi:hypothetical protein